MIDICRLFKFKICKKKKRKGKQVQRDSILRKLYIYRYKLFDIHGLKQGKKLNFEYLQSGCLKKRLSKKNYRISSIGVLQNHRFRMSIDQRWSDKISMLNNKYMNTFLTY